MTWTGCAIQRSTSLRAYAEWVRKIAPSENWASSRRWHDPRRLPRGRASPARRSRPYMLARTRVSHSWPHSGGEVTMILRPERSGASIPGWIPNVAVIAVPSMRECTYTLLHAMEGESSTVRLSMLGHMRIKTEYRESPWNMDAPPDAECLIPKRRSRPYMSRGSCGTGQRPVCGSPCRSGTAAPQRRGPVVAGLDFVDLMLRSGRANGPAGWPGRSSALLG